MNVNLDFKSVGTPQTFQSAIKDQVNQQLKNITYNYLGIHPITFTKDFAVNGHVFSINENLTNYGIKELSSQITKQTIGGLTKKVTLDDPKVIYFNHKNGVVSSYVSGLQYYNSKSKSIRMSQSGGITIFASAGGKTKIQAWNPTVYKIEECNIFGAINYNGTWKGVRFSYRMN